MFALQFRNHLQQFILLKFNLFLIRCLKQFSCSSSEKWIKFFNGFISYSSGMKRGYGKHFGIPACLMKSCQLLCLKIEIVSKFPIIKFQCLFDEAILGCLQKLKHFEWWNKTYIRMFQPFLWGYASMNVDKKFKTG